jgi:hypothetical protein
VISFDIISFIETAVQEVEQLGAEIAIYLYGRIEQGLWQVP